MRGQRVALGQQQREQAHPLLTLGAVRTQLASLAAGHEIIAVRAVAGEPALQVTADPLAQLCGQLVRGAGL